MITEVIFADFNNADEKGRVRLSSGRKKTPAF